MREFGGLTETYLDFFSRDSNEFETFETPRFGIGFGIGWGMRV